MAAGRDSHRVDTQDTAGSHTQTFVEGYLVVPGRVSMGEGKGCSRENPKDVGNDTAIRRTEERVQGSTKTEH